MDFTYLKTDNHKINTAYYIAMSDLTANIKPFSGGLLEGEKPVIIAGIGYYTPWTRDASINTANAGGMLFPGIAKNTLMSVLKEEDGKLLIDGEYWDAIIWVWGAWNEYLYTGDREFLLKAYDATVNSLAFFEETEFDEELNLFRGPACYGDGVAAYPDIYARPGESGIIAFAFECKEMCADKGVGIPMHTLSTNCLYYEAYVIADLMAQELGLEKKYVKKAQAMKEAINKNFWIEDKGRYGYIVDKFGGCDYTEGMGESFAILFGIADEEKAEKIFKNQHITKNGIPCVWPSFSRYDTLDGTGYGRHSGTVWPHIQAFWADASSRYGKYDLFCKEFDMLTECSVRDGFFAEIYHPDTGEIYGGRQEFSKQGIIEWESQKKQTWSATGYLHMIFMNIAGMSFKTGGIKFTPYLPSSIKNMEITNLHIRNAVLNIKIEGQGAKIKSFKVDGKETDSFVAYGDGVKNIEITVEE
jgi:glycogen debranching enzyme